MAGTVENLLREIGLETTLSEEGFDGEDIEWLTESALRCAGTKLTRNPVPLSPEDIRSIYESCM